MARRWTRMLVAGCVLTIVVLGIGGFLLLRRPVPMDREGPQGEGPGVAGEPTKARPETVTEAPVAKEDAEARLLYPPNKFQEERVGNIRREKDIRETVEHLADFDDWHLADTSPRVGRHYGRTPRYQREVVTQLFRVRKLMEVAREHPDEVIAALRPAFAKAVDEWVEAVRARLLDATVTKEVTCGEMVARLGLRDILHRG